MKIAIFGASSQIARDLICSIEKNSQLNLLLYVRDKIAIIRWLEQNYIAVNCSVHHYDEYGKEPHDVVINFVGIGDPQRAMELGIKIFDITQQFDEMILEELAKHPDRRYIFISSGAAYGAAFDKPVETESYAKISINNISPRDYYSLAKLYTEVRHRSLPNLQITDVRVFNYFSRSQDLNSRFFIAEILRAIRHSRELEVSDEYIVRDYIHPSDFYQLVKCLIVSQPNNWAVDCYSASPVDKPQLLEMFQKKFDLKYRIATKSSDFVLNATGSKPYYYSKNYNASQVGYKPSITSLDCIAIESEVIMKNGWV